jgi:hypothetical protein
MLRKGNLLHFLGEYYRILFLALRLLRKPFNSGILLLPSFSSCYLFFFLSFLV